MITILTKRIDMRKWNLVPWMSSVPRIEIDRTRESQMETLKIVIKLIVC